MKFHFSIAGTLVFLGWLFAMFCITQVSGANEYSMRRWAILFYSGVGVMVFAAVLGLLGILP